MLRDDRVTIEETEFQNTIMLSLFSQIIQITLENLDEFSPEINITLLSFYHLL